MIWFMIYCLIRFPGYHLMAPKLGISLSSAAASPTPPHGHLVNLGRAVSPALLCACCPSSGRSHREPLYPWSVIWKDQWTGDLSWFIYSSCSLYSLRTTNEGPWDLKQVYPISFGDPSCVWAITKNSRCQASWSGWSLPEGLESLQHPTGKMQTQEKSLGGWTWNAALDIPMALWEWKDTR